MSTRTLRPRKGKSLAERLKEAEDSVRFALRISTMPHFATRAMMMLTCRSLRERDAPERPQRLQQLQV